MFDRILVPIDGSATARRGLDEAIAMAKLAGGRIRLLHVAQVPPLAIGSEAALMRGEDILDVSREAGRRVLAQAVSSVASAGIAVDEQLLDGNGERLCDQVAEVAQNWRASLIVLGSHGRRGIRRALLGSDAEQILRIAPVPVLLVRDGDAPSA